MLRITIPAQDLWDEEKEEFVSNKKQELQLEHSLVSLSKWESKWHKPFLNKDKKTDAEILDYIRCMTITQNVDPKTYASLTKENLEEINKYISDPMTATTFSSRNNSVGNRETMTSEVIYYYMIALNIPVEFQKWHLNRLITLIRVCSIKQEPPKKMGRNELLNRNAALNAARRKQLNTKG